MTFKKIRSFKISPTPIFLLWGLAITICLIIGFTLFAYYRSSLLHFNWQIDKDYFPAFGNFIGSTIGIFISIVSIILIYLTYKSQLKSLALSKTLIDRQISISVKPLIIVKDFDNLNARKIEFIGTQPSFDGLLPVNLQHIHIDIINAGRDVAKQLQYNVEYNPVELIKYFTKNSRNTNLKIDYSEGDIFASLKLGETDLGYRNVLSQSNSAQKDYLMPYRDNSDYFSVSFPSIYILIYYYVLIGKYKNHAGRIETIIEDFPKCFLNLSYHDLEGKNHNMKFQMDLEFLGATEFFNPEKAHDIHFKITSMELS